MNQAIEIQTGRPDLELAQAFLDILDPFTAFTFQTFDDDKARLKRNHDEQRARGVKKPQDPRAKTFNGLLQDHAAALARMNADRAGVFVTVNETDGTGRKADNITRVRGVFCEIDRPGENLEEMTAEVSVAGKTPTIVESSPGKYHFYLLTDSHDIGLDEFKPLQKAFIRKMERFGSDAQINDLPRVMRLPGFYHCKGEPFMARIIAEGDRFTPEEIREALGPFMAAEPQEARQSAAPRQARRVGSASIEYALEGFHATVNRTAMANFDRWVPVMLPQAYPHDGGYRITSADLGRTLEEDLSFHPKGIKDHGSEEGLTPIDAALRYAPDLRAQQSANKAAFWLCDQLGIKPEDMGWTPAPGDALEEWRGLLTADGFDDVSEGPRLASVDARTLAEEITKRLHAMLEIDAAKEPELAGKVAADAQVIDRMINGSFWSGSKNKLFLLNPAQSLVQFLVNDAYKFLAKTFGKVIDRAAVEERAAQMSFGGEDERRRKHVGACMAVAKDIIIDHLKYHNQRDAIEWRVDMFATQPRLELIEDRVRLVLTHRPFEVAGTIDPEVIADYKDHFPRFDEFLMFLVMARFAIDRKKAYLWIFADSDWGKGLLIDGVLGSLSAKVETSVREIEAMFEGKPVGRAPEEFKRAFALVVNEFKHVKAEIKQLESTITLAPKHQLSSSVEVFAKVFTSAESVGSLVTENGVEDQFANRMSIFKERGSIDERPVWQAKGKARYAASLTAYAAEFLNREIQRMQAAGRVDAQTEADRWLDGFIKRNGLDTLFERFSESLPEVAQDVIAWLHKNHLAFDDKLVRDGAAGAWYLKSPNVILDRYLEEHFDKTEIGAYRKRKAEIIEHMSADGNGVQNRRINGRQGKSVMLKPTR